MWKMQLLDEKHLLIKYASEDVVTLQIHYDALFRVTEPASKQAVYHLSAFLMYIAAVFLFLL